MERTKDELDRDVIFFLSTRRGEANPMGRWELVERVFGRDACEPRTDDNLHDRHIRAAVERLRNQGHLICELFDGRGRFLASTAEEYWTFRSKFAGRAFQIIQTVEAMDAAAIRHFGAVVTAMKRNGPDVSREFVTLYQPKLL